MNRHNQRLTFVSPQLSVAQQCTFRHWTRKNYAAFASLNKQVKIGVLATSCSLIGMHAETASAQNIADTVANNAEREVAIDDIIVAGNTPIAMLTRSSVMASFDRQQIAALPVSDVQQLLEHVAGIDLRQRGAGGVQADVRMRGGSEEQTLILLNGISVADPRTGHHSLNVPIDLASVARVEIIQLPGTFAGAVNIITGSDTTGSGVKAHIAGGEHFYIDRSLSADYAKGGLSVAAAASMSESAGYIHNTDYETVNGFTHIRYRTKDGGIAEAQAGYQHKRFGANSFYSVGPDEFEDVATILSSLAYSQSFGRLSLRADAYQRRSFDNYGKYRDSLAFAEYNLNQDNYHQGDVVGGDVYLGFRSRAGHTVIALQPRAAHIFSNKLGEPMDEPRVSFEPNVNYTYEQWRTTYAAFVKHNYTFRRATLAASVIANYSNSYGYYTLGNAQAGYDLGGGFDVTLSAQQSLRLPTFTDLYYNGKGYLPNPDLKPERAVTFELGTRYRSERFTANAGVFYRFGEDLIDWLYIDDVTQQCRNHVAINTAGVDVGATYVGSSKYVKSLSVSYSFLNLHSPQELNDNAKGRLFAYLKHKVTAAGAHGLFARFEAAWSVVCEQRNGTYRSALRGVDPTPFTPVVLVDARLQWREKNIAIYVSADNILDMKYYDYNAVVQPGRWFKTGIKITIF